MKVVIIIICNVGMSIIKNHISNQYFSIVLLLLPCRPKRCQTTVARQRAFPSLEKCAGLGLPMLLVHLNTGLSFILHPGPTLA